MGNTSGKSSVDLMWRVPGVHDTLRMHCDSPVNIQVGVWVASQVEIQKVDVKGILKFLVRWRSINDDYRYILHERAGDGVQKAEGAHAVSHGHGADALQSSISICCIAGTDF